MAKFLILGSYTPQAVAGMLENPSDRAAAVQRVAEAVGGRVLALYWMLGAHDFAIITEAPDTTAQVAAIMVSAASGGIAHLESHPLIDADDIAGIVAKARQVRGSYSPPGR